MGGMMKARLAALVPNAWQPDTPSRPRRYWLSTLAVAALLIFLGIFTIIFLVQYDSLWSSVDSDVVLAVHHSLFFTNIAVPHAWHFQNSSDGGWLILIAVLGFITPFLELITWIPLPAWPRVLTWRSFGSGATLTSGAVEACPDKLTPTHRKSLAQRLLPTWLLHLSPGATIFLILSQLFLVAVLMIAYAYRYLYLSTPNNMRLFKQMSKLGNVSQNVLVVHALGRTSGWPLCVNFAMMLIPVDRSSSWLGALNMSVEEANIFHRVFGWSAAFWSAFHAIFQHVSWGYVSYEAWKLELMPPAGGYYNAHTDRFIASVGGLLTVFIVLSSLTWVRQYCYNFFRISHLAVWVMLPLLIMHEYYIFFWMAYGFIVYSADLAQRWVLNSSTVSGVLTVACDKVVAVTLRLSRKHMKPDASWAAKVVYLRIGRVSFWETHPFSISSVDGDTITLHVGALGNWTNKLYALASAAGPEGLEVTAHVEGPYGDDLTGEIADNDTVVLVAGGVGITPVCSTLQSLLDAAAAAKAGGAAAVHVLWVVRQAAMSKILPYHLLERAATTAGFSVKVFVTNDAAPKNITPPHGSLNDTSSADEVDNVKALKQSDADAAAVAITLGIAPRSAFRTWLPRFACKTAIVWMATAALIAGYVIACQIVYVNRTSFLPGTHYAAHIGKQYNATVMQNYYRNVTHLSATAPLPANASAAIAKLKWPKAQPLWSKVQGTATQQAIFGHVKLCVGCSVGGTTPASFPFGMAPFHCCRSSIPIAMTFIRVLFPIFFATVFAAAVAYACTHILAARWPLHSRSSSGDLDAYAPAATPSVVYVDSSKMLKADLAQVDEEVSLPASAWRQGRPNFNDELSAVAASSQGKMVVYSCGPLGMRTSVRAAVYGGAWLGGVHAHLHEFHVRD